MLAGAGAKRWPLVWTLSAAAVLSLLLWVGVFFALDLVADLASSARPTR